jgi:hypothetical protein
LSYYTEVKNPFLLCDGAKPKHIHTQQVAQHNIENIFAVCFGGQEDFITYCAFYHNGFARNLDL